MRSLWRWTAGTGWADSHLSGKGLSKPLLGEAQGQTCSRLLTGSMSFNRSLTVTTCRFSASSSWVSGVSH